MLHQGGYLPTCIRKAIDSMFSTLCSRLQAAAELLIHQLKPRMDTILHCLQYFKPCNSWLELSQLVVSWVQGFGFRVKLYWAFWVPRLQIAWEPWRDGRMRSHSHRSSGRAGRPENGRPRPKWMCAERESPQLRNVLYATIRMPLQFTVYSLTKEYWAFWERYGFGQYACRGFRFFGRVFGSGVLG